jgi:hypothetical protein
VPLAHSLALLLFTVHLLCGRNFNFNTHALTHTIIFGDLEIR